MNEILTKNLNILKTVGKTIIRYVWYWHFLFLVLILIWVYFFSRNYFLRSKENIKFIKDNIADITYTQLEIDDFTEVYQTYQDKIHYHVDMPADVMSPF
ncbi:MAG: hypothetical protein ABH896_02595 [Candidatus Jacksonbacteria bacterium]